MPGGDGVGDVPPPLCAVLPAFLPRSLFLLPLSRSLNDDEDEDEFRTRSPRSSTVTLTTVRVVPLVLFFSTPKTRTRPGSDALTSV